MLTSHHSAKKVLYRSVTSFRGLIYLRACCRKIKTIFSDTFTSECIHHAHDVSVAEAAVNEKTIMIYKLFMISYSVTLIKMQKITRILSLQPTSQQIQNICITFVQRRPNIFDVGPTLYKCYTNVLCLLRCWHLVKGSKGSYSIYCLVHG